eukprot:TRINITY_DN1641_c0_g1_i2.p1 TRINITY_DN1641_c0_g1~~TRINITY_DN1641_c0_g1_i2.p1  ORF type:complete len:672 (+),score=306.56 TRINITY_DN1641_c0_g1_i2:124-2016(+)
MRAMALLAAASVALGSPLNPYPAQDLGQKSVGTSLSTLLCQMLPSVNATNIDTLKKDPKFVNEIAKYTCYLNRGIFALQKDQYKGYTYSCNNFPAAWCKDPTKCTWQDVLNDNEGDKLMGHINEWFEGMFNSSIEKHPADCTFDAYGAMSCPTVYAKEPWRTAPWVKELNNQPIRGVNIGGLFVLEPWINRGFANWGSEVYDQLTFSKKAKGDSALAKKLLDHWETWYTQDDFNKMAKDMQLNTVRLPLGWWYFAKEAKLETDYIVPTQNMSDKTHPINKVMMMAKNAGLKVIVDLHGAPCSQNGLDNSGNKSLDGNQDNWGEAWLYDRTCMESTHAVLTVMARWVVEGLPAMGVTNTVLMLELVNEPWVFNDISLVRDFYFYMLDSIRKMTCSGDCPAGSLWTYKTLPLLWHDAFRHFPWTWLLRHMDLTHVFFDTHLYHAFNIADVASDNEQCDRQKVCITENIACQYDGLLTFKSCTSLPVFVGEWALAIDNCMPLLNGAPGAGATTRDNWNAGQCGRAADRMKSLWWTVHFQNFANRQIYTFEQQLGWAFWCFKVDDTAAADPNAPLWSMTQAFQKGFLTAPYGARYLGGCSQLEAVPECLESNTNKTLPVPVLPSDVRNLRGRFW